MDKHLTRACAGIAFAALAGQFLLGCDSAGSSRSAAPAKSPGASASVPFPVAVGDTWTYTLETLGLPPAVLVKEITGITPVPGGRRVSMAITSRTVEYHLSKVFAKLAILCDHLEAVVGVPRRHMLQFQRRGR
jgi:hypothetical protein